MELFTTAALWKNYDRNAQPLDVNVISSETDGECTIEYLFFNGDPCADGCARIYAKYIRRNSGNGCGIVLMNDYLDVFDSAYADMLIADGYNVLIIDYVGRKDAELYTIYPRSLEMANCVAHRETLLTLPDNPKESCWYVWATVMLRGITFLENREEITGKISVFGVGLGAFQVWKTAFVEKKLACGIALFNSGYIGEMKLDDIRQLQYNTCIDNKPYAREVGVPVLLEAASNSSDGSIEYLSDLYNGIQNPNCVFSIGERCNRFLNASQLINISVFLGYYNLGINTLPEAPVISVRESEHILFYEVRVDQSLPVERVRLYVSQGSLPAAYRNWHDQPLIAVSEGVYIAKVSVFAPKEELCAFVTTDYKGTLSISSEVIKNVPFLLNVYASSIVKTPLVYSVESGIDDWTVLGNKNGISPEPVIKDGTYGIKGITSDAKTLTTFKFGEPRYRYFNKSLMQISAYLNNDTRLTASVVKRGKNGLFEEYVYSAKAVGNKEWIKLDFHAKDFRSFTTRMESFDGIVSFTVSSIDEILINSIIMV